jgi:hypothetical protein
MDMGAQWKTRRAGLLVAFKIKSVPKTNSRVHRLWIVVMAVNHRESLIKPHISLVTKGGRIQPPTDVHSDL